MGAIPPTLMESELFGYEAGAFTGAVRTRPGIFEVANGGTIFLDEIGEASLDLQVKLLVIEEGRFMRRRHQGNQIQFQAHLRDQSESGTARCRR